MAPDSALRHVGRVFQVAGAYHYICLTVQNGLDHQAQLFGKMLSITVQGDDGIGGQFARPVKAGVQRGPFALVLLVADDFSPGCFGYSRGAIR
jgi:hypothetical protein